ncbi:MAG: ABC transporter ATP-binding protein [Gemmatimonadaceae bacterium]
MAVTPIQVQHVSKRFRLGERHDSLRDLVPAVARRLRGGATAANRLAPNDFWAVDDVSFSVAAGEAVGIIGPNGAGKSTMLKLLTKILRPTLGNTRVRGRVGALIEIAAGFHPDLTGRENVYLQGAIMGMRSAEITQALEGIVDFSGIGHFIDTPVKRYSSGMNARLGFSIAAHLKPDVLIIDEVLAVGDMAFQAKCIARMKTFKHDGAAIVFVSHNLQSVAELCDRAVYLHSTIRAQGPVQDVIGTYLAAAAAPSADGPSSGNGTAVAIVGAKLTTEDGAPAEIVAPGTPLRLSVEYLAREPLNGVYFSMTLYRSTDGLLVYGADVDPGELGLDPIEAGRRFTITYDFRANMTRGQYHLETKVHHGATNTTLAQLMPAGVIGIAESRSYRGVADLLLQCRA